MPIILNKLAIIPCQPEKSSQMLYGCGDFPFLNAFNFSRVYLTNAPSTFQGLMNSIFKPFLRKFVLVFFDHILIYDKSWKDHVEHVDTVLQLLEEKQLYGKRSKCFFGVHEVEYLGHIVSHEGVKVDPKIGRAHV